ncbi:LysR family transcriptional regulator [Burkholderia multivorans]|uniref:LysR family transcriptional regulator n=1 Tax=Burkholderia multivorans TaxID=87883 RepID=UPI00158B22ED|nr:LysR family transcriptional regulator [Burkholderia multivorans]
MFPIESLSGVATFVATAQSASFTEAAEKLGISKSAVGKSIARLEERLGVKLFHRTTRRITLSTDGEAFFAACSAALDEISAAESALSSRSREPAGRLRIDMPAAFGRQVLLPILLEIARTHPAVHFTMTFADHVIDPIEEGVDLTIRFGELQSTGGLVARRLTGQRWVICAAPGYLQHYGTPQSLDDLNSHHAVVGYRRGQPLPWRVKVGSDTMRFSPPATHQIDDAEAMIEAAVAELGLCQMPQSLFRRHIESGRLVTVLDQFCPDPVDIHAVWPKVAHLRPKIRYVVDALVALAEQGRFD